MKANQTSKAMEFSFKSTSTVEGEGLANELAKYKNPQFDTILQAIREY